MASDSAEFTPPEELEEYRIVRLLGHGAMGRVYLAEDRLLKRLVAVKFIAASSPSDTARERLFVEARAVARLSHPNVVTMHRVGEVQRRPFLVSEYVRGRSLDHLDKPVAWQEALTLGIGLARGLAAAHRRGVLHRDIKPANAILSEEGDVKLLDFGLAELAPETPPSTDAPRADEQDRVDGQDRAGESGAPDSGPPTLSRPPGGAGGGGAQDETARRGPGAATQETRAGMSSTQMAARHAAGTPLYMAPELFRGEPSTARSDVYSLGVLLYELCAGRTPHNASSIGELSRVVRETAALPIAEAAPGIDPRFAAVIDRCLERDPGRRFGSGDALREALERLSTQRAASAIPEGNPYRGLLAFEAEHRGLFFGRSADVRAVIDRLRAQPFVLVAGDSGAGKSSLCRAGVLPAVAEGALGGKRAWTVERMVPGRRPVAALAAALAPFTGLEEAALIERLAEEPASVAREVRRRDGRDKQEGPGLLLFVDQLEELWTLAESADAAVVFEALCALTDRPGSARVLATVRSDFLARLASAPGLGEEISGALYLLRPLSTEQIREAVVGPAAAKGFSYASDALVDALVEPATLAEGGLPLLQFALAELWEARDEARRVIPASALEAVGGVAGALARHADGVLAHMPAARRVAARSLLLGLVTAEGTRERRTEAELLARAGKSPEVAAALEALVRGRLVVAQESETGGESSYTLAHEALLSGWDTLRGWLGHDVERRAARQRLERAAAEWERLGRSPDALWSGRHLREVGSLDEAGLSARELSFLSASRRAARRRRHSRAAAVLAVPLLIGATVAGLQIKSARDLERRVSAHVEEAERALTEARAKGERAEDLRRAAFARFDAKDGDTGKDLWRQALTLGAEVDRTFAHAMQELEVALRLGGDRADVRDLLGDALYERAVLADRDDRRASRDELLQRLGAYDDAGEWRRRWEAPGSLAVASTPPGAEVRLWRLEAQGGRRVASPDPPVGTTPLAERALAQGSFVIELAAEGRASVRLPLVVGRAERLRVTIALPPASAVPEGFVLVPPGRFLFGSNRYGMEEIEGASHSFDDQPLHAVETGAYLIARYEVTFADWIAYLRALSPDERAKRTPAIRNEWHALELSQAEGGAYKLLLKPTTEAFTALEGGSIRYPGRSLRSTQRWLRLPVAAVSYEDAAAYAAFLDRTGRVPGARLCDEYEWERAARGADDRLFPSGDRLEPDDANHDVTYGRDPLGFGPDEVGSHPSSESPFGVHDLAGNVWEWVVSVERGGRPILRGGSWYQGALSSLSINREPAEPTLRSPVIGVRICATPARPSD